MVRETLLRAAVIGIETTAMGFCRRQERLDSSSDKGKPEAEYSGVAGVRERGQQWIENYGRGRVILC